MTDIIFGSIDYVRNALAIMERYALYVERIPDWEEHRKEKLAEAANATSMSELRDILKQAAREVGGKHSFLVTPDQIQKDYQDPDPLKPSGNMINEVGYLKIPHCRRNLLLPPETYVDLTHAIISELDVPNSRGWVIDLRGNGGGNMWPMIAGVGPLFGEGAYGFFRFIRGSQQIDQPWSYSEGVSMCNGEISAKGSQPPCHLKDTGKPIAVLVDENTASSGEAVFVATKGLKNVRSFGCPTAGFSTANRCFPLADGSLLVVTTSVFVDRTGKPYGEAIVPDVLIYANVLSSEHADPVLARACHWLRNPEQSAKLIL